MGEWKNHQLGHTATRSLIHCFLHIEINKFPFYPFIQLFGVSFVYRVLTMRRLFFTSFVLSSALRADAAPVTSTDSNCLPVVDLGYVCRASIKSVIIRTPSNVCGNRNCIKPSPTTRRRKPICSKTLDMLSLPLATFDSEPQRTQRPTEPPSKPAPNCDSAHRASRLGRMTHLLPSANTRARPMRSLFKLGRRASNMASLYQWIGTQALKKIVSSSMSMLPKGPLSRRVQTRNRVEMEEPLYLSG